MNIPNKVLINCIPYKVEVVEQNSQALNPKLSACVDYATQTIYLSAISPEIQQVDFLHECIHAMIDALGYEEHDEKLVDGLAHQLFMFHQLNADMFK